MSEPTTAAGRALLAPNALLSQRPDRWLRETVLAIEAEARAALRAELVQRIEQADHDWLCAEEDISDPDQWTEAELAAHEATLAAVLDFIRGDADQ